MPQVCLKAGEYQCRSEADHDNWSRSGRLFNNPTKQDRYPAQPRKGFIPIQPPKASDGVTRDIPMNLDLNTAAKATKEQERVWGP